MATIVYVWFNSPTDVGHVSLQVGEVYMSFWPRDAAKAKADIKIGQTHAAAFPSSYKVDVRLEGREADSVTRLNRLNEDEMKSHWQRFKLKPDHYNMRKSNCSTVVAALLELGCGVGPTHTPCVRIKDYVNNPFLKWTLKLRFLGNYIRMWTPTDVRLYALQIKSRLNS